MRISLRELARYPMPSFLKGRCEPGVYGKWLHNKADTLLKRDKKRGKPYAVLATRATYKDAIHRVITAGALLDPFTGEALAWELISTWGSSHDQPEGYKKQFALMPTVDHKHADSFEFEICSWQTNDAKSDMEPREFVAFCERVARYKNKMSEHDL